MPAHFGAPDLPRQAGRLGHQGTSPGRGIPPTPASREGQTATPPAPASCATWWRPGGTGARGPAPVDSTVHLQRDPQESHRPRSVAQGGARFIPLAPSHNSMHSLRNVPQSLWAWFLTCADPEACALGIQVLRPGDSFVGSGCGGGQVGSGAVVGGLWRSQAISLWVEVRLPQRSSTKLDFPR